MIEYINFYEVPAGKLKFQKGYQQAKYEIWIYKDCVYSFVTTKIPEKECIKLLEEKLETYYAKTYRNYYIYKKVNGKQQLIKTGINPNYLYKKQKT